MFLYVITNTINGKQYIGIATEWKRRKIEHYCGHGSKIVYAAIKKYGQENLIFRVLCEGSEEYVKELEPKAIAAYNTKAPHGYNLTDGGEGSTGWCPGEETRRKMSERRRGEKNAMYGRTHSTETRKLISEKAIGRPPHQTLIERNKTYGGSKNPNAKAVTINGITYGCLRDAATSLGIKYSTLRRKVRAFKRTGKWPGEYIQVTI